MTWTSSIAAFVPGVPRPTRVLLVLLVLLLPLAGCYVSHERSPRTDAETPDATADVGADTRDSSVPPPDSFMPPTDTGRPLPEVAITLPCEPSHVAPAPGGNPGERCDLHTGGDHDGDGFSDEIDCHDCSPQVNPGAYDFPGNGIDEDCDGLDGDDPCDDTGLPIAPEAPSDALRAMGLCRYSTERSLSWGVIEARYTTADGRGVPANPVQVGILEGLGSNPPFAGESMFAMSTGIARPPPGRGETWCAEYDARSDYPPGFPVDAPACPGVLSGPVYDAVALEVRIRVPTNVSAFRFASAFYTHEYPDFICSPFNDVFAVLQDRGEGLENIVFDAAGNPVTVNNALLRVCLPEAHGGREDFPCELGYAPLIGTGYDVGCPLGPPPSIETAGASTGCIETTSRVRPGEIITLRFTIWDSGDPFLDSTALIDGFEWVPDAFEIVAP